MQKMSDKLNYYDRKRSSLLMNNDLLEMNNAKIQTFRGIGRRGSTYNLIKDAKAIQNMAINQKNDIEQENSSDIKDSPSSQVSSSVSVTIIKEIPKKELISTEETQKSCKKIRRFTNNFVKNTFKGHKYEQKKLPVITNSKFIIQDLESVNKKDLYYNKFFTEGNFGEKYAKKCCRFEFEKKTHEELIEMMGLNDEEKNPMELLEKKTIRNNKEFEKKSIDNSKFLLFKVARKQNPVRRSHDNHKDAKDKKFKINYNFSDKNRTYQKTNKKKNKIVFSIPQKEEFSDFLIMNFLKVYYPKVLKDATFAKTKLKLNNLSLKNDPYNTAPRLYKQRIITPKINEGHKNERKKIFVIQDSAVISNPRKIPGFVADIPTVKAMKEMTRQQRLVVMEQFFKFTKRKFHCNLDLKFIFYGKGRCPINDFTDLPEKQKYIFVSNCDLFRGLSIPLNKNIIDLYIEHFYGVGDKNDVYFNNSSIDEGGTEVNSSQSSSLIQDDVYDIYFGKKNIKEKKFKKKLANNKKKLNGSFTFGIDDDEKYEYVYYSDDEGRKIKFYENQYLYYKSKIDFYIDSQNEIYDNKIKRLLSKLRTNEDGSIKEEYKCKNIPSTKDLLERFLTEQKIPKKNLLKDLVENKPLTGQDICDAFNLLKNQDSTIDENKFILHKKGSKKILPFVEKNIKDNSCKYCTNQRKTNTEFPTILSYNLPLVVGTHPKYSIKDLIKYYTKFKSLVNLWLNMHNDVKMVQYGIDLETFYYCNSDLCNEDYVLVKKIFEAINSGTSGVLSLEDYVDALNTMNRDDLGDQFEFFLRVFQAKNKEYLSYDDIFTISKISIKRLLRNKDENDVEEIVRELGEYFTNYLIDISHSDKTKGINVEKLKELLLHDTQHLEYLKIFLCTFANEKKKKDS